MSPRRLIWTFFVPFLLVYGLLMAPWPGYQDNYRKVFITGWQSVFGLLTRGETVRLSALDDVDREADTIVAVRHRRVRGWVRMKISSRQAAYLPTAVMIALLVATPIPWRRRTLAFLWGVLLVHAFIGLRLGIMLLYGANRSISAAGSVAPTIWEKAFSAGIVFITVGQAVSYIGPILIWILVAVRREDVDIILRRRHNSSG